MAPQRLGPTEQLGEDPESIMFCCPCPGDGPSWVHGWMRISMLDMRDSIMTAHASVCLGSSFYLGIPMQNALTK